MGPIIRSIIWGGRKLKGTNLNENPFEKCSSQIQKSKKNYFGRGGPNFKGSIRDERLCKCNKGVQSLKHCLIECVLLRDVYEEFEVVG